MTSHNQEQSLGDKPTASPKWLDIVEEARRRLAVELGEHDLPTAEMIIREMREERDRHLANVIDLSCGDSATIN